MPIFVYEEILDDGSGGIRFEYEQGMNEPLLEISPFSSRRVRKVYLPPHVGSRYSARQEKSKLETKHVENAGFTKYERDKLTGVYHKTAGKSKEAPSVIDPRNL